MLANAKNDFDHFELYAWDKQFFWSVKSEALGSPVCGEITNVNDDYLNYRFWTDARKSRHVADVEMGMLSLAGGPLVEEDIDVDI